MQCHVRMQSHLIQRCQIFMHRDKKQSLLCTLINIDDNFVFILTPLLFLYSICYTEYVKSSTIKTTQSLICIDAELYQMFALKAVQTCQQIITKTQNNIGYPAMKQRSFGEENIIKTLTSCYGKKTPSSNERQ